MRERKKCDWNSSLKNCDTARHSSQIGFHALGNHKNESLPVSAYHHRFSLIYVSLTWKLDSIAVHYIYLDASIDGLLEFFQEFQNFCGFHY